MSQTTLYPYQRAGVRAIQGFGGRCILGDDVGLGKTLQTLYWADRHLPDDPPGPVVCIVPAHLRLNWKREARKHLDLRVEILYGERVPPEKLLPINRNQIYVIGYDVLTPPNWKPRTKPPADSWTGWLEAIEPRLVIADEAHLLANPSSARSRAVRRLARAAPHVLLLTGTAMLNNPMNLWPLLNIVAPKLFQSRWEFGLEFTHARKMPWSWEYKGARNLDRLHRIMRETCLIRRRKREVLSELPLLTRTVVPVEVDLREYRRAEADYVAWVRERSWERAESAARAEDLARMNGLMMLAAELKLPHILQTITDYLDAGNGKLLVGALHHRITYSLRDALGRRCVLVDGDLSGAEKDAAFARFNDDPDCDVLVGNMLAAGTGWNCTGTSDGLVCEYPWRPSDLVQFEGRVDGLERGLPGVAAHFRYPLAVGTIEEDVCGILSRKQRWSNQVLDGEAVLEDAIDVHSLTRAALLARHGADTKVGV